MNKKGNQRCWTEVPGVCCNPRRHDTEHTNEFIHLNMDNLQYAICLNHRNRLSFTAVLFLPTNTATSHHNCNELQIGITLRIQIRAEPADY